MAERNQQREIRLTATFRDRLTRGLRRLRDALRGTEERTDRLVRSGTRLGRAMRRLRRVIGRASNSLRNAFRGGLRTLRRIVGTLTGLRTLLIGIVAAVGLQRLFSALREVVRGLDQVAKRAARLGIAATELTRLQVAAERAGIDFNTLSLSIQRMVRRVSEAAQGTGEAQGALRELNIQAEDFVQLPISEQLTILADRLASVENQADRVRLAFKLFDSEGAALLQLLQQGGDEVRELLTIVDRLAPALLSPETFRNAERITDALANVSLAIRGVVASVVELFGKDIAGFLERTAQRIASFGQQVRLFVAGLREAFRDDEVGRAVREQLDLLRRVFFGTMRQMLKGLVIFITEAVVASIQNARTVIAELGQFIGTHIAVGIQKAFESMQFLGQQVISGVIEGSDIDAADASLSEALRKFAARSEGIAKIHRNFIALRLTTEETIRLIQEKGADALAKLIDSTQQAGEEAKQTDSAFKRLADGITNGFDQATQGMTSLGDMGRRIGQNISTALGNVSDTLVDIVVEAKNAGEAFRQLAVSTLGDLAELILRATVLRALLGPGGTLASPTGGILGFLGFNRGGKVELPHGMVRMMRFASGGAVPGPDVNRDTVPAMLTPGEFVMDRAAASYYGDRVMHALLSRSIPRSVFTEIPSVTARPAAQRSAFQQGGAVDGGAGQPQPAVATVIASDAEMSRLLSGGSGAMIRFLRERWNEYAQDR